MIPVICSVAVLISVVSRVAALLLVLRMLSTRFVAPIPTLYNPRGEREDVVVQQVVEMRTKSGTNKRLRFSRNTPLPRAALPDAFFLVKCSLLMMECKASSASDDFDFVTLDCFAIEFETKGFFRFIIGCMTSGSIRSPSAKMRLYVTLLRLIVSLSRKRRHTAFKDEVL